jgi:hypothetical protein
MYATCYWRWIHGIFLFIPLVSIQSKVKFDARIAKFQSLKKALLDRGGCSQLNFKVLILWCLILKLLVVVCFLGKKMI